MAKTQETNTLLTLFNYPRQQGEVIKIVITDDGVIVQRSIEAKAKKPLAERIQEQHKALLKEASANHKAAIPNRGEAFIAYLKQLEIDPSKKILITAEQFGYSVSTMQVMISSQFNKAGLGHIKCSKSTFMQNSLAIIRIN